MNELKIKKMITNALELEEANITDLRETAGGLTNASYFATVNGEKYVVRIPGVRTDELVNRQNEMKNLEYGTGLGINPAFIYCDPVTGFKITHKIENALTITRELAREGDTMKQIIQMFKFLHSREESMENEFKLFDLIAHYESLVSEVNELALSGLAELSEEVGQLKEVYQTFDIKQTPCHVDPVLDNMILDEDNELYLIDWEYSGMFDPLWDITILLVSLDIEPNETSFFLSHYLERQPSEEELQRILMHTIFQDYLWTLWFYFKESQGDDIGDNAIKRPQRAKENIQRYKKHYATEHVG